MKSKSKFTVLTVSRHRSFFGKLLWSRRAWVLRRNDAEFEAEDTCLVFLQQREWKMDKSAEWNWWQIFYFSCRDHCSKQHWPNYRSNHAANIVGRFRTMSTVRLQSKVILTNRENSEFLRNQPRLQNFHNRMEMAYTECVALERTAIENSFKRFLGMLVAAGPLTIENNTAGPNFGLCGSKEQCFNK